MPDPASSFDPRTTRRTFVGGALAGAASLYVGVTPAWARKLPDGLFSLGVASGDPLPDGVVLWTRLAPDPLHAAGLGGISGREVPVRWEVAHDEAFVRVVRRGNVTALADFGYSVHVDVRGLQPGRAYFYRFISISSKEVSPLGRTKTAPATGSSPQSLRFAFASCQDWQNGYYAGYRDMAEQDLDVVVHLGDYIYEYGPRVGAVRPHDGPEVASLASYRNRYALYHSDEHLRAAHGSFPWLVTWDDHEVENNYAGLIREEGAEPNAISFADRRANAYRAWYENMPVRLPAPSGPDYQIYRRFTFGDLAEFSVLDTRQYRSDQPCGDGLKLREACPASVDPAQTMTGPAQERWLLDGLANSGAVWNAIANQAIFVQADFDPRAGITVTNMDQWDGYVAARRRILDFLAADNTRNPVVITGDIHSSWVADMKHDFDDPGSETLGTEFVGSSISSDFPAAFIAPIRQALPANPHFKFFDGVYRGYVDCTLSRQEWRSDFRAVQDVTDPSSAVTTLTSWKTIDGAPGAIPA